MKIELAISMYENWLYALAQCGASFVAIIGAFYTTKIHARM